MSSTPVYPCSYNFNNVICVTAIDQAGQMPGWANHGTKFVHLAAPGVSIKSTVPYGYASHDGEKQSRRGGCGWKHACPKGPDIATTM